jgi:hypothetical protein
MTIYLQTKQDGPFIAEVKLLPRMMERKKWKYFLHQLYSSGRKRKITGKVKR